MMYWKMFGMLQKVLIIANSLWNHTQGKTFNLKDEEGIWFAKHSEDEEEDFGKEISGNEESVIELAEVK